MNENSDFRPGTGPEEQLRRLIERGSPRFIGATQALRAVRLIDDWASVGEVADEIAKAPDLERDLVRLASSAIYGGYQIRSLHSAVEFLGYEELRRALLTLAMTAWAHNCGGSALFDPAYFRRRVTVLACMSESLASHLGLDAVTKYYLAGIFADIGYMFLAVHVPSLLVEARAAACPPAGATVLGAERDIMGCTHATVSAIAAQTFGIPCDIVQAVAHHHTPWDAPLGVREVADVVHVASAEADAAHVLPLRGARVAEFDPAVYDRLRLTRADAGVLFSEARGRADLLLTSVRGMAA